MDTTAQSTPVQSQMSPSNGAQPDTISTSGNVPQTSVPPVSQQPITGGHPEAPVRSSLPPREAAPVDEAEAIATVSDDQAVVPDEAADAVDVQSKEAADVKLQESHPQVEIAKELQEAGVEKGKDADRDQLPEEQIAKADDVAQQPDTQASASGITLPMSMQQAEETKKKSKIRDSFKWLAELILYQWKRVQVKGEDDNKSTNQQIN